MAVDAWVAYNSFRKQIGDGTIDLDSHTFKCALFLSTSNAGDVAQTSYSSLTNQHSNANGYTTGGVTVTATWNYSGTTATFDCTDPAWTASGGSIVARWAVIYDDTPAGKSLVAFCLMDDTPADITVTSGNTLTLQINPSGVFTLTGMA